MGKEIREGKRDEGVFKPFQMFKHSTA